MREFLRGIAFRIGLVLSRFIDSHVMLGVLHDRGVISDVTCSTHDMIPMTDEEQADWWGEDGGDDCLFVVRLWSIG